MDILPLLVIQILGSFAESLGCHGSETKKHKNQNKRIVAHDLGSVSNATDDHPHLPELWAMLGSGDRLNHSHGAKHLHRPECGTPLIAKWLKYPGSQNSADEDQQQICQVPHVQQIVLHKSICQRLNESLANEGNQTNGVQQLENSAVLPFSQIGLCTNGQAIEANQTANTGLVGRCLHHVVEVGILDLFLKRRRLCCDSICD
mmetsp:Transcript_11905/g.26284  ORF Transcript_11905/g.26284 Transcript_11905/m.26284 type:complete len:203 (+) Transcript_11905:1004-1612(+)